MQSPSPTTFFLLRHAQTVWNKEHRHTGNVEVELSDKAEGQILKLTKKLSVRNVTALYSSPLSRCQITIKPLSELLKLPVTIKDSLIERDLGSWEGKHPEDLLPTHPGYEFPQSAYNGQFIIPGAETLEDLERRLRQFLHDAHEAHPGEKVAVSTHSGVIWAILHRIVTNPPETFFWPQNCSITTVVRQGNHYSFVSEE